MTLHPLWFPKKPTWPSKLGRRRITRLQRALNKFCAAHLTGYTPLIVDGHMGTLTRRRIRQTKFYLGMVKPGRFSYKVNRRFIKRLAQPNDARLVVSKSPAKTIARGKARRRHQAKLYNDSRNHYSGKPHWVTYDGKMVAAYFEPSLNWARHVGYPGIGKWSGQVVSGGRTAAYSIHLCMVMCGRPFCPGRCAGAGTNHVGDDPHAVPSGAIDVSDYVRFGRLMAHCPFAKLGTVAIKNDLPIDPVHYSPSGH